MRACVMLLCTGLAGACASTENRVAKPTSSGRQRAAPLALEPLTAAVRTVAGGPAETSHRDVAAALRQLAAHVGALPAVFEGQRIEQAAARLEAGPADADTELVQRALRSTQRALEKTAGPRASIRTIRNLAALDTAIGALDANGSVRAQRTAIIAALESAANTLALLRNDTPVFDERTRSWPAPTPQVALANAREHALAMASADFTTAASAAARVIEDLASVAASYGPASADAVTRMRFQAQRLASDRPGVLDEARWIGDALTSALDALERGRDVRPQDARDAIANIAQARGLAFQRAAVQDAVRATISAIVAAETTCASPPASAAR